MMAHVIPFPAARRPFAGTVCVMGDSVDGFQVAHESSSGDSWGSFTEYATGQEAITAAYALNRDTYGGECDVSVCDAALQDACPGVGLPSVPGDF
jgi:hypothetical protein